NNWFAAYAYWYFRLYGHGDVQLLDGGRKKWELDGRPLSKDAVTRDETSYSAQDQNTAIRAFRDEVVGPSTRRTWSTCAGPTSSPASCSRRPTCRRSRRSAPGTSRRPSTCRGARRRTRTGRSAPPTSCASCTRRPGSTSPRPLSRTAASVS